MDNRPIGVFDSGLGGLTAVRKLMDVLPNEEIIYLGDTGRVPYGSRSKDTIIKYARQDMAFLSRFDIKAVVVACGTVSTTALDVIQDEFTMPIYGVVDATAKYAADVTENGKIGLIGTEASIRSGAYEKAIRKYDAKAEVFSKACPLLVPLVENGRTSPDDIVICTVVAEYLSDLKAKGIDTLVLGCTHYPLLIKVISQFMGPDVKLVNSGAAAAERLMAELDKSDARAGRDTRGKHHYYVTDSIDGFVKYASLFLETDVEGDVKQVSLDNI